MHGLRSLVCGEKMIKNDYGEAGAGIEILTSYAHGSQII
jgi:hypothetical protein